MNPCPASRSRRLAFLLLLCLGAPACAQPAATAMQIYLDRETSGLPGRVEATVGPLDPRFGMLECRRLEPFLAPGSRLWGRSFLGVRCAEGPAFSAFVPVHVKVFAQAPVAARALPAGSRLEAPDVRFEEAEISREAPGVLLEIAELGDRVLARPLQPGQLLRPEYFRAPPAVTAGDTVKIMVAGRGFAVSTEGRALNTGADGQPVRVQTPGGKTLTGTARDGKIVRVSFF